MKSNTWGMLLSAGFILASGAYAYAQSHPDDEARVVAPTSLSTPAVTEPSQPVATGGGAPPSGSTPPTPAPAPTPKPKPVGQFADGTYTGPAVDAYYGLVQVKATVSGGKLTDVAFLQYPNDRSTSREINNQAMPWLTQEAIQAQSASVDIISGATATSEAFIQSLGAALSHAKA